MYFYKLVNLTCIGDAIYDNNWLVTDEIYSNDQVQSLLSRSDVHACSTIDVHYM